MTARYHFHRDFHISNVNQVFKRTNERCYNDQPHNPTAWQERNLTISLHRGYEATTGSVTTENIVKPRVCAQYILFNCRCQVSIRYQTSESAGDSGALPSRRKKRTTVAELLDPVPRHVVETREKTRGQDARQHLTGSHDTWRCFKLGCKAKMALRSNTYLSGSRPYSTTVLFIYAWAYEMMNDETWQDLITADTEMEGFDFLTIIL
ncbi:uncharacterized protein LOC112126897 [Cimex lectularius]|uniref:Uncharacterized protein n=1 Tax=Cimex lectularius TaxID=79782 RepID=A0A8I6TJY3_CIMLE|nr:uncharacterized protein LOC112126897 [Cimex lectularius]